MEDVTPKGMRCGWGSCPSIHKLDDRRLMIVGRDIRTITHQDDPVAWKAYWALDKAERIGSAENAVLIDEALLEDLFAAWLRERGPAAR